MKLTAEQTLHYLRVVDARDGIREALEIGEQGMGVVGYYVAWMDQELDWLADNVDLPKPWDDVFRKARQEVRDLRGAVERNQLHKAGLTFGDADHLLTGIREGVPIEVEAVPMPQSGGGKKP